MNLVHRPYVHRAYSLLAPAEKGQKHLWSNSVNGLARIHLMSPACPFQGPMEGHVALALVDDVNHSARITCAHSNAQLCVNNAPITMTDATDCVRTHTLHTQEEDILWAERYNEPEMRQLPDHPMVCVRAQMGMGKSKAIISCVRRTCIPEREKTSVLYISYSISLCKAAHAKFKSGTDLPWVLYSDRTGSLLDHFLIVCLDSLYRIPNGQRYHLIIIDEVHSVLLHFNSAKMEQTGTVSHRLECLLTSAGRVLMADAVCDSTLVKLAVDRLQSKRGQRAFWVRNDHVRPTSRNMQLHVEYRVRASESMRHAHLNETFRRLDQGENVVAPSNSAKQVTVVAATYKNKYPDDPDGCAAYWREGPRKLRDPHKEWPNLRCLSYSPSISSGISFEVPHFHSLVAYFVISPHTPGVDTMLQQLWRVRALTTGEMVVFMQVEPPPPHCPHTVRAVSDMLLRSQCLTNRYLEDSHVHFDAIRKFEDDGSALFDSTRLSWDILRGLLVCKNRSLTNGPALFVRTLTEDYGVNVKVHFACPASEAADFALDPAEIGTAISAKDVPFSEVDLKLTDHQASALEHALQNGGSDLVARATLLTYQARTRWGIGAEKVDEDFYTTHVFKGDDILHRLKRFRWRIQVSSESLRQSFSSLMSRSLAQADPNLELWKHKRRSYMMVIHGQELLEAVLEPADIATLNKMQAVQLKDTLILDGVAAARQRYSLESVRELASLFFSKPLQERDDFAWFSKVMRGAFHLDVSRASRNRGRAGYHDICISPSAVQALVHKYRPECFEDTMYDDARPTATWLGTD